MGPKELYLRLRPPLWARWAISAIVAVAAVVLLVRFVSHNNNNAEANISTKGERQELQQARTLVGQDQAPRVATIAAGSTAQATLTAAVKQDMKHKIAIGTIDGPLNSIACHQTTTKGVRSAYSCRVKAAGTAYPFLAVADASTHHVIYCKRDLPPIPSENIPISRRCRLS
jgi:hypothetical protein